MIIRFVPEGTLVNHPQYGTVTVVRNVNRGELTNTTGFPPGTWVTSDQRPEPFAVYANTEVTVL